MIIRQIETSEFFEIENIPDSDKNLIAYCSKFLKLLEFKMSTVNHLQNIHRNKSEKD